MMKKTMFMLFALGCGVVLSTGCGGPETGSVEQQEESMEETMGTDPMGEADTLGADAGDGGEGAGAEGAGTGEGAATE